MGRRPVVRAVLPHHDVPASETAAAQAVGQEEGVGIGAPKVAVVAVDDGSAKAIRPRLDPVPVAAVADGARRLAARVAPVADEVDEEEGVRAFAVEAVGQVETRPTVANVAVASATRLASATLAVDLLDVAADEGPDAVTSPVGQEADRGLVRLLPALRPSRLLGGAAFPLVHLVLLKCPSQIFGVTGVGRAVALGRTMPPVPWETPRRRAETAVDVADVQVHVGGQGARPSRPVAVAGQTKDAVAALTAAQAPILETAGRVATCPIETYPSGRRDTPVAFLQGEAGLVPADVTTEDARPLGRGAGLGRHGPASLHQADAGRAAATLGLAVPDAAVPPRHDVLPEVDTLPVRGAREMAPVPDVAGPRRRRAAATGRPPAPVDVGDTAPYVAWAPPMVTSAACVETVRLAGTAAPPFLAA